jgi:nucleoside-diphosphate-sugar epimerase
VTTVAVTGATGSVGRRVVQLLAADPEVSSVLALDRVRRFVDPRVEFHQVDVTRTDVARLIEGCDSLVHLAEDPGRRSDVGVATEVLDRVLTTAERVGCGHVVLLSSALVYGAYADNPIPITEGHERRPVPELAYATTKARLEEIAEAWAASTGAGLAILRPTTTLSERGVSYIAALLRAASSLRPPWAEPPVQFLHHDDLAAAVANAASRRVVSSYNVAPDGWIGPEVFHDLVAEAQLPWTHPLSKAYRQVAGSMGHRPVDRGLDAYVTHPWVVANDRLRSTGWAPTFSNEEAYVLGTPPPTWMSFAQRRRQELALSAFGLAAAAAAAGAGAMARRLLRNH